MVGSLQATLVLFADEGVFKKGAPEALGGGIQEALLPSTPAGKRIKRALGNIT